MASYIPEVEDVKDDGHRPSVQEVTQGDVLIEAATEVEAGSRGPDGEGWVLWHVED